MSDLRRFKAAMLTIVVLGLLLIACAPVDPAALQGLDNARWSAATPEDRVEAAITDDITDDGELIPLALGNSWHYESALGVDTIVNDVDTAHVIGDDTWYRIREFNGVVWVRNTADGQLDAYYEDPETLSDDEAAAADLFFRHPLEDGTAYSPLAGEEAVMTYTVPDMPCTVPAGSFPCIRFEMTEPDLGLTWLIAPGVGILEHTYAENGETVEHWILTRYVSVD